MRKRGFLSLCLVTALSVTTASSLYSCKDYDDEIAELQDQILNQGSTLQDLVNAQIQEITNLKFDLGELKQKVETDREALENELQKYLTKAEAEKANEAILKKIDELTGQLAAVNAKISGLEKSIEDINALLEEAKTVKAQVEANKGDIAKLYTLIADLKVADGKITESLKALGLRVDGLEDKLEGVENSVKGLDEVVNNVMGEKLVLMSDSLAKVYGIANANAEKIKEYGEILKQLQAEDGNIALSKRVDSLSVVTKSLTDSLNVTKKELVSQYEVLSNKTTEAVNGLKAKLNTLNNQVNVLNTKIAEMQPAFDAANEAVQQVEEFTAKVGQLEKQVNANTQQIVALNEKLDTVKDQLNKLITSINLNGAYSPVIGYFNAPIGMKSNILAAYYGSTEEHEVPAFPTTSSICSSVVGNEMTAEEFSLLGIVEDEENIAWAHGATLLDESEDNAGTLYMTLNPTNVDLSGTDFKLVNSEGKQANVVFGKPVPSNHRLSFGYSRAGSNNGFYEVKAKVTKENIADARLRIDLNKIKDAVKDVLSTDDGVDMTKLISTLYTEFNDIADANAVEATWQNDGKDYSVYSDYGLAAIAVKPLSYIFMQDYNIDQFWGMDKAYALLDKVAAKGKELSKKLAEQFPEFDEIQVPNIDTIKVEPYNDTFKVTIVDSVNYHLNVDVVVKPQDIKVGSIIIDPDTIDVMGSDGKTPVGTVKLPGDTIEIKPVHVPGDTIKVEKDIVIPIKMTVDMTKEVKELYEKMTGTTVSDVNKMIVEMQEFVKQLQPMLDELNGMRDKIQGNLNQEIDKIQGELKGYLDKINGKLCSLVEGVNAKLQPVMFVKTADSFAMLSQAKNYPSYAPSSFVLSPSSYTAELLAPAFKKFVAITDVLDMTGHSAKAGNGECVSVLKNSNKGDLNKVIEGKQLGIKVEGLKSGYVYEFTYSALDYMGYVANSKYYVYVK